MTDWMTFGIFVGLLMGQQWLGHHGSTPWVLIGLPLITLAGGSWLAWVIYASWSGWLMAVGLVNGLALLIWLMGQISWQAGPHDQV